MNSLVISRSRSYTSGICHLHNGCMITDHMILPLLWNRDSYYVAKSMLDWHPDGRKIMLSHLQWLFDKAWRGTFCEKPHCYLIAMHGHVLIWQTECLKIIKLSNLTNNYSRCLELADYFERFPEFFNDENDAEWKESIKSEVQQFIKILR